MKPSNKHTSTDQTSKQPINTAYDVVVLGGGAAGLMAAATAGQRGQRVLLIEVSNKLGKKILMSGGGRCNFTNLDVKAEHFLSSNPHFVKSALSQYSHWDFISLVSGHGIEYHEKDHGQLFCNHSAKDIVTMLITECKKGNVEIVLNTSVKTVSRCEDGFRIQAQEHSLVCRSLIVATGGLSIPTLGGATGFGYQLAKQFDLNLLPREASLVPFTMSGDWRDFTASLSGVSLSIFASVPTKGFSESMLFTHRGLSGPAILQLSNYWHLGEQIELDLLPHVDMQTELLNVKRKRPNARLQHVLLTYLPKSVVGKLIVKFWPELADKTLQEMTKSELVGIANGLHQWRITPSGTEGYRTAEVTRGGVSVDQISSKTMQHKEIENLFFVGEVLDVTGHLGGFNFQWAWSSGYVAGLNA